MLMQVSIFGLLTERALKSASISVAQNSFQIILAYSYSELMGSHRTLWAHVDAIKTLLLIIIIHSGLT